MKKTLTQTLLAIRNAVGKVPRNGIAEQTKERYAKLEDILDAVDPLLAKHKLLFTGSVETLETHPLAKGCVRSVVMNWKLEDTQSGHERSWRIPGGGADSEFEGSGIAQAVGGCRKAAYTIVFGIRTEDVETGLELVQGTQAAADAVGDAKAESLRKRAATVAAKEFVRVSFPDAFNGHKALFVGRLNIMEHSAFEYMQSMGKFVDREDGWLVGEKSVNVVIDGLRERGCTVLTE